MRKDGIPYVPNPVRALPVYAKKSIDELDLQEIIKHYLCGKSQGKLSVCAKCPAPCEYGKRAIELAFPSPEAIVVPTYAGGRTMIEMAKMESAKRRAQQAEDKKAEEPKPEESKSEEKIVKKRHSRGFTIEGWYDKAFESDDPLKWIVDNFECTPAAAKQKVYAYQHVNPKLRETKPMWGPKREALLAAKNEPAENSKPEEPVAPANEPAVEPTVAPTVAPVAPVEQKSDALLGPLESKINALMNKQEEYKSQYEHYLKLYNEVKVKVDALYEALNILSEG